MRKCRESSGIIRNWKTKLTDMIAHFLKKDGQVEDREEKYRPYRVGLARQQCRE